ncbi:histidine kinase, partial [Salinibacterium sp.]
AAAIALGASWATSGSTFGISNLAVLVLVFLSVVRTRLLRLVVTLVAAVALVAGGDIVTGIVVGRLAPGGAVLAALTQSLAVIGLPLLAGLFVRGRRDVREARNDEQQARMGQRDAQIQAALSRERAAMARELHDIAAHHVSAIALMSAVVDRQIDTDPLKAHLGVQQVRAQSTMVLDDLRRLVGLLRDDAGGERSVETLSTVPELVDRARALGSIELQILSPDGRVLGEGIGPLAQLAVYRTIQEALMNAAKHAPGATRVVQIDDRDDVHAVVTVTNAAPSGVVAASSSGGFGLLGMRERADLVGADLRYGPMSEGGWQVRVAVPRELPLRKTTTTRDVTAGPEANA